MDVSALLEMVHADPRDLAARAVYADALLEAGDPRGEFIALQLARERAKSASSPRERELHETHRAAWIGPIADATYGTRTRFANGFLRTAGMRNGRRAVMATVFEHPEWRTVELLDAKQIEGSPSLHHEPVALLAQLPRLSALIAGPNVLRAIVDRVRSHPLARLELAQETTDLRPVFALLEARTLPELRYLRVLTGGIPEDDLIQLGARLGPAVELTLAAGAHDPDRVARLIERLVTKVRAVAFGSPWGTARATLHRRGIAFDEVHLVPPLETAFYAILDRLGRDRVVLQLRDPVDAHGGLAAAGFAIELV